MRIFSELDPNTAAPITPHPKLSNKIIISPLTNISSDGSVVSIQSGTNESSFILDDGLYTESTTHPTSFSCRTRLCGNFSQITYYSTKDVFNSEIEQSIESHNEKSIIKFLGGVDVVYQTKRKTYSCVPLFCPARIVGSGTADIDVVVGISFEGNSAFPIIAAYDSHGTMKNLVKSRTVLGTYMKRICPTHFIHDFTEAEMIDFEEKLKMYLKIRNRSDELQGLNYLFIMNDNTY